jgi:hypothetical protein
MCPFTPGDRGRAVGVEVTGVEAGVLDGVVECVDVLVAAGCDRDGLSCAGQFDPVAFDSVEVLIDGPGLNAALLLVQVEGSRFTGAQ